MFHIPPFKKTDAGAWNTRTYVPFFSSLSLSPRLLGPFVSQASFLITPGRREDPKQMSGWMGVIYVSIIDKARTGERADRGRLILGT